jgi:soluble lytic murein transglycosylase-like protein
VICVRGALLAVLLLGAAVGAAPAEAELHRLVAADGTVYYTNAATDPRYARLGLVAPSDADDEASGVGFPYHQEIMEAAKRYGVPPRLVAAIIRTESDFNPQAVSIKGARGLMQLMPATARALGVADSFDPRANIDGGVRHLRGLLDRLGNDLALVLAAYNAGEQAVAQHRGVPPYPETQHYVARVLRLFGAPAPSAPAAAASAPPEAEVATAAQAVYRTAATDGTLVYSNVPPDPRVATRR